MSRTILKQGINNFLNQYYQQNMKHLALDRKNNSEKDILNPQDQPETPKKLVRKTVSEPALAANRLKFRLTIVEKSKQSRLGIILIISWVLIIFMLLFSSYHNKLKNIEIQSLQEQARCKIDYDKNRCENGLKATFNYCQQKRKCFQSQPNTYYQGKISTSFIAGQIIRDFVDGAGLYVCAGGLIMIWILMRRPAGKEIRKQYQQYFQ